MLSTLPDPPSNAGFLDDPASNLAAPPAYSEGLYPTPPPQLYRAYDGTPIGYSKGCDPISAEPMLSGLHAAEADPLMVPAVLAENRFTWGAWYALPALTAAIAYHRGYAPLQTALWGLAAYMAPLPAAGLMAYQLVGEQPMGRSARYGMAGLGRRRYRR